MNGRYIRGLFRKYVPFRCKKESSKVSYKILLLSDSTFFKLFFHVFAAIIEALILAGHKFLCTLLIECGRCGVSHFCNASFRSSSSSNRLPPGNFFRCRKRWKSLSDKSELYGGVVHLFPPKWGDEVLSLSSRVRPSIIVKQKNGGTQHSAPFVLNCTPQLLQRFTINSIVYCCALGQNFYQQDILSVPEYGAHDLPCWNRLLEPKMDAHFVSHRARSLILHWTSEPIF